MRSSFTWISELGNAISQFTGAEVISAMSVRLVSMISFASEGDVDEILEDEVSQVLFRLSRWENLEHAQKI